MFHGSMNIYSDICVIRFWKNQYFLLLSPASQQRVTPDKDLVLLAELAIFSDRLNPIAQNTTNTGQPDRPKQPPLPPPKSSPPPKNTQTYTTTTAPASNCKIRGLMVSIALLGIAAKFLGLLLGFGTFFSGYSYGRVCFLRTCNLV